MREREKEREEEREKWAHGREKWSERMLAAIRQHTSAYVSIRQRMLADIAATPAHR